MINKKNLIIFIFTTILMFPTNVFAQNTIETTYNYNWWGNAVEDIPFFELYDVIDKDDMGDVSLSGMDDVTVEGDRIYIIDTIESRVNIFDENFKLTTSLKLIRDKNGKIAIDKNSGQQVALKNPEGIFVDTDNQEIYIADTGNERIVVIDEKDFSLKRLITKPNNIVGQTTFKPSKIVVDKLNRIYVVVQSSFEGIIELTPDGEFKRYFGVNKPKINLIDYFWKQRASEQQKAKMTKFLAPSFNNIAIDDEGFIYATTFDSNAKDKVFRLNPKGQNILREEGTYKVVGDGIKSNYVSNSIKPIETKFVDLAVTNYGAYAVLDKNNGRIFIYNFDGLLLNIFGEKGFMKGQFSEPTSIAWLGDNIIVTDKILRAAYVFKPTHIGEIFLQSNKDYYNGEWDKSTALLKEAMKLNSNLEVAYRIIANSYLMEEDYQTAMYYAELGANRTAYSKAFNGYRSIWIKNNFPWIFILMLLGIFGIGYSEVRYYRKLRKKGGEDDE